MLPEDLPPGRDAADPIALSDGNVFTSEDYGMSTHGGFGLAGKPKRTANTWRARC